MEEDLEINFHKLEKEFKSAVAADAKYQRENAAKFRAVEQRVGSYEEFKDIVAASHLRPLDKHDRIAQERITQPWNTLSSSKHVGGKTDNIAVGSSTTQSKLPQTQHEFSKVWSRQLKTKQDKYAYLCNIGGETLGKIFKMDISMGLLGEIVVVLNDFWDASTYETVFNIVWYLSMSTRFKLSLEFLSASEKNSIDELFLKLKASPVGEEGRDKLIELAKIYKVDIIKD